MNQLLILSGLSWQNYGYIKEEIANESGAKRGTDQINWDAAFGIEGNEFLSKLDQILASIKTTIYDPIEQKIKSRKTEVDKGLENIKNAADIVEKASTALDAFNSKLLVAAKEFAEADADDEVNTKITTELEAVKEAIGKIDTNYVEMKNKLEDAVKASDESVDAAESVVIALTLPDQHRPH